MSNHKPKGLYELFFKRVFDFIFSLLMLIILSPIILILAILVRINLGSPIIFVQERPGLNENIFNLYKFRTMTNAVDKDNNLLPDSKRLTKFGIWLRSTSLDELPELFNIIKGEMSFIGPRPLLVKYLDRYTEEQHHRHDVRPGLTGLAQVNGRNLSSWEDRFRKDIDYINNITFLLDLSIFIRTVGIVLKREGISSGTDVTMETFMGTKKIN